MKLKLGRRTIKVHRREILGFLLGVLIVGGAYELTTHFRQDSTKVATVTYRQEGVTIQWLPQTVQRWSEPITKMGQRYNIDPNLIAIIMAIESGGYSKADSGVARGLMQVTPYTAGDIATKFLKEPRTDRDYDLFNPETNIEFGAAYLAYLQKTFCADASVSSNECVELIAAGYNGGPGAANSLYKGEGLDDMETVGYSRDARNLWRERGANRSPTYERWLERGGQGLVDAAKQE